MFVRLKDYDTADTPKLLDGLRQQLKQYPNARIYVREFQNGPPITAPIAIRVVGDDLDTLYTLSAQVEKVMKETPGTRDIENPVRMRRTNLQARRRFAQGGAARRAHGRVRSRRAARRRGHSGGALQGL